MLRGAKVSATPASRCSDAITPHKSDSLPREKSIVLTKRERRIAKVAGSCQKDSGLCFMQKNAECVRELLVQDRINFVLRCRNRSRRGNVLCTWAQRTFCFPF